MSDKIKFYKNPARNKAEAHNMYVPQYKLLDVEPEKYISPTSNNSNVKIAMQKFPYSEENQRNRKPSIRQPYAEIVEQVKIGALPNIGNNVEQTWSSIDSEIIDDISDFDQSKFIDNNDFVSENAFGQSAMSSFEEKEELPVLDEIKSPNYSKKIFTKKQSTFNIASLNDELNENEYMLFIESVPFCSGSLDLIQEELNLLVFGEHSEFDKSISIDDILIIKRVKLKVGAFIT